MLYCDICLKNCAEKGMEEYWGNAGEYICEKCKRRVCNIHFNETKKVCFECLDYL